MGRCRSSSAAPTTIGLARREPVGDGADDDVGAGAQDRRQEQASLVLQDPVTPSAWLDFGDEDGDLPVALPCLLCLPDVADDRVDQRSVRAGKGVQSDAGVPAVPFGAEGGALPGFGVDADGDDVVAEGQCCTQGVLGELADAADGYDHQAVGRQRPVREPAQVEFESYSLDLIVSYSNAYDQVEDVSKRLRAIMATGDSADEPELGHTQPHCDVPI